MHSAAAASAPSCPSAALPDNAGEAGRSTEIHLLPIAEVRQDGGTQLRTKIHQATVERYAEIIDDLPCVTVFDDGNDKWLADGFYRIAAALLKNRTKIRCDVRQGSLRDALLFAAGANAKHGVQRSPADDRLAVRTLLNDPEWVKWSDRKIARHCGVSAMLVGEVRTSLNGPSAESDGVRKVQRGKSIFQMRTKKIGRPRAASRLMRQTHMSNGQRSKKYRQTDRQPIEGQLVIAEVWQVQEIVETADGKLARRRLSDWNTEQEAEAEIRRLLFPSKTEDHATDHVAD